MSRSVLVALLGRVVLVLGLLLSALAPATIPAVAQTAPPSITFSPNAVPVGGSITVAGSGFSCNTNATIDLYDSTGSQFIANLGTVYEVCTQFNNEAFTLPTSVVAGQYRVRGSDTDKVTPRSVRAC